MSEDSNFTHKVPCPSCGSKDNLAMYSDGHGHCFGCGNYVHGDGSSVTTKETPKELIRGEFKALAKRNLSVETCRKYGYQIGEYKSKTVQIAPYFRDGVMAAQKIRFPNKDFKTLGEFKNIGFFGQHLFSGGKKIVICEGEIDTLTVSQIGSNKWPTIGVPAGAQSAAKVVANNLNYFKNFEEVVLMFDMDEPGQKAALECARVFPSGKVSIASLSMKDPNELLLAGKGAEIVNAIWNAAPYKPDGVVTLSDVKEKVLEKVERGLPWFLPTLDDHTYGRRYGEVYALGAGTGVGKTDLLTQQIEHDTVKLNEKVGLFFLEQQPTETLKRIAGKHAGKKFHVPDDSWTDEQLSEAVASLDNGNLFFYDHFGVADWDRIEDTIRYLFHANGVRLFYLDHLTALATGGDSNEREELERIMAAIGSIVKELDIIIHLVSHLATPEGKPHEEGGRVAIRHFKGSRAIGFWCHFMFGMERDQQAEDLNVRRTTTFRILKDRLTGQSVGECIYLGYEIDTGRLFETVKPPKPEKNPFSNQEVPEGNNDF